MALVVRVTVGAWCSAWRFGVGAVFESARSFTESSAAAAKKRMTRDSFCHEFLDLGEIEIFNLHR